MKTQNAFAFRDFDPAHILQRPFFRDFHFDTNKSDAQILESLSIVNEDYVEAWERNLYVIKATHERLIEFRNLINKHNETRLSKYNKKILTRENTSDFQRSVHVMEYFNASLSVLELMNKFKQLYCEIEKKIQIRYRKGCPFFPREAYRSRCKGIPQHYGDSKAGGSQGPQRRYRHPASSPSCLCRVFQEDSGRSHRYHHRRQRLLESVYALV